MSVFVEEIPVDRMIRKTKKKYSTKYNPKYREDFPWALPSVKGDTFAFCHFCKVDICIRSVGAKGLRDHALTCRHSQRSHEGTITGNDVMQDKPVIHGFSHEQPLSNTITHGYQSLCPSSGQISNENHISNGGQLSVPSHLTTHNQMTESQISVEPMKLQEHIDPNDPYGFTIQENNSRYTSVTMADVVPGTMVPVGNVSSTHPMVSQSPHSSVNTTLYSVVGEDCTTLQPLYSYPPQIHPGHGMRTEDQTQISCEKSQIVDRRDMSLDTTQESLDPTQGMFQSSQSSYESGSSSSHMDKSGGLSVEDLTCNVCGTVFDNWMDLKNDLLLHIKHAQEQPKRKHKTKKRSKLPKKTCYPDNEKDMSYTRRKGRPPGTKKKFIEDSIPVMESTVLHDMSSQDITQSMEQTISTENYYVSESNVVAPSAVSTVQEHQIPQEIAEIELSTIQRPMKKSNTFTCRVCEALFTSRPLLKDHLKLAHNNGRPFQCEDCKKFFTKKSNLEVHKKHKHSGGEDNCKCTVCGKVLSTRTNLRIHLRIHEGKKPFACKVCSKKFNRKANLEMHNVYHTGERKFTCEMCGKSFFAINALKRHRKLHTGERDYVCKICGATYVTSTDLRRHVLKHQDVKPFPCTLCEKQFTRSHDLKVHVRYHNKDHQFTCPDCKKKFVESGNYRRHLRRHTGERPYVCIHCFQTFTQVHHYKVHVQNQHKDGEECARNRMANSRIPNKNKSNVLPVAPIPQESNNISNPNMTVVSQSTHSNMPPLPPPTHSSMPALPQSTHSNIPVLPQSAITTAPQHQQMTNVLNSVHTIHGPSHPVVHPSTSHQVQPHVNSTPGGVIHQYSYVYNSTSVPHYHTIFDVCPQSQQQ